MFIAITRAVSRSIEHCELTHLERQLIDLERAREQHHQYEQALRSLGVDVHSLPEAPSLPDSVFVEDIAVVLDECAIITRPGADSRRPETEAIVQALSPYREMFPIIAPGTVDGGDVLTVGKTIYVGQSSRSNEAAVNQMQSILSPFGYQVRGVEVTGCLHLKSAITRVAAEILRVNPDWVKKMDFTGMHFIDVDPSEPYAANVLMVGESLVYQPAYPKTLARLETAGLHPVLVDQSELAKAEGALTCCSLIFNG
jgi:dimethylargininase